MSRKVFSLLFVLALIAVVAPTASAQDCPDGVVTLRMDDWSSGDRVQYMEEVLAAFHDANPCIEVVTEPAPGGDEEQHLRRLTMITAGTAPDLVAADSKMIPLYATAGGWMDLTPFLEGEEGLDPEETFFPSLWELGQFEGKPLLIPKDYSTSAFYVNTALFEAAGIDLPEE